MDTSDAAPFDPTAPLGGPPDPWAATSMPVPRPGAPSHMREMIEAEPWLARRVLERLADPLGSAARLAAAIAEAAEAGQPIVLTGCGTSEHGALGGADLVREALGRAGLPHGPGQPSAAQAFELALRPPTVGLVIGISHEGATWATNRALEAARDAGARTAVVTVTDRSPAAAIVEPGLVVETGELDASWCHTVGYLSPLLALAAAAGHVAAQPLGTEPVARALTAGLEGAAAVEAIATALRGADRLIVVGSGADRTAGRELALKLEEGTWVPSAYRDLETMLHGHWPGTDGSTGLVLILAEPDERDARIARARQLLAGAGRIGISAAGILAHGAAQGLRAELTPAGRVVMPEAPDLPAPAAALFATAVPLQLLTERLARARGTDPDPIRRDDPVYADAAAAAEG